MKRNENKKGIYYVLLVSLFFASCKREYIGIHVVSHFENTQVLIEYDNKIIIDSILTTNYSIVRAARLKALKSKDANLKVIINDSIQDSIKLNKSTKIVYIEFNNNRLEFTESNAHKINPLF